MSTASFALTPHPAAPDGTAVAVTGEIDITNAVDFVKAITERADSRQLVVDFSDLCFVDSAGFAALDDLLARDAITIVIRPGSRLRRAATLMGLPYLDELP
ncbi:STAS domain-containing protein [Actinophytocola sp.]|uniref:STAS domain-containing protein n=1 Tax=Actinophytocola sp. TaxID=1872138 RepID=UPI002D7E9C77|nr:STAS domain-containing protein [Actinophytocola sp.]HET9141428.1 STAS domain-containing protein [Actinophytocola sp.]